MNIRVSAEFPLLIRAEKEFDKMQNAARWRELGNSAETRIFIIPTPINNNNTNVVIGLSFRLSSPTIPKGRQAAS